MRADGDDRRWARAERVFSQSTLQLMVVIAAGGRGDCERGVGRAQR
jgi:hypothetical protein